MTEAYLGNVDLYNDLNAYLANLTYTPVSTLGDIIEFNDAIPAQRDSKNPPGISIRSRRIARFSDDIGNHE